MNESTESKDLQLVQHAVDHLGEYFDTVHIFATRHESGEKGGTVNVSLGSGNWFARYGQIRSWIVKEDQSTKISVQPQD